MRRVLSNELHLWKFENLLKAERIDHFVTERHSNETGAEFTLSYSSSPDKELIRRNRHKLAIAMGVDENRLVLPSQVHKTRIVNVTSKTTKEDVMETDSLMTSERGICIAVMSADCVPILLYDKKNQVIAAVHSGWRGTVARILEKTLAEMKRVFGTQGKDIITGIGPSVCQESYEVGEEVVTEVTNAFGRESSLMILKPNNKAQLDLWKANKIQLLDFGVNESAIEISDLCTVKNNEFFFSARKGDSGRFAAGIVLK